MDERRRGGDECDQRRRIRGAERTENVKAIFTADVGLGDSGGDKPVASGMATKNVMTLEDIGKPKDGAFYRIKVMLELKD